METQRKVQEFPSTSGPSARAVTWGGLVFLSGIRGIDPSTGQLAVGEQARLDLIMRYLDRLLVSNGSVPSRVLSAHVFVTNMARYRPMVNAAFERFLGPDLPTRTIVEVAALNPGDTIEIEVIAACCT
jgi:2-iminobutanoate/2-iminopropanoate deaminase